MDNEDVTEAMIRLVRELVQRELEELRAMPLLGEDGLDRLSKIALILQRTKPSNIGGELTDRALARKAAEDGE